VKSLYPLLLLQCRGCQPPSPKAGIYRSQSMPIGGIHSQVPDGSRDKSIE
jgi:hypothetical protein